MPALFCGSLWYVAVCSARVLSASAAVRLPSSACGRPSSASSAAPCFERILHVPEGVPHLLGERSWFEPLGLVAVRHGFELLEAALASLRHGKRGITVESGGDGMGPAPHRPEARAPGSRVSHSQPLGQAGLHCA